MERSAVKYLLDTAVWINGLTMPEVLPPRIRRLLEDREIKGLCSISLLETAILHRLGRLDVTSTLAELFSVGLSADLKVVELTAAIATVTNELPAGFPGDPFDRAIVATATLLDLTLVTADTAIRDSRVCAVEYYPFKQQPSRTRKTRKS
jgi:PIN domain nuclease of toxin-antitoxin system